jgi:hypothetical protein
MTAKIYRLTPEHKVLTSIHIDEARRCIHDTFAYGCVAVKADLCAVNMCLMFFTLQGETMLSSLSWWLAYS